MSGGRNRTATHSNAQNFGDRLNSTFPEEEKRSEEKRQAYNYILYYSHFLFKLFEISQLEFLSSSFYFCLRFLPPEKKNNKLVGPFIRHFWRTPKWEMSFLRRLDTTGGGSCCGGFFILNLWFFKTFSSPANRCGCHPGRRTGGLKRPRKFKT